MRSTWVLSSILSVAFAAFVVIAQDRQWLSALNWMVYDTIQANFQPDIPSEDTVVIAIDEKSIASLGAWPWRRQVHADLLASLEKNDPSLVVFDILFTSFNDRYVGDDDAFAQQIAEMNNVILPLHFERYTTEGQLLDVLPVFAEFARALGHVHIECEHDGICRSVYLKEGIGQAEWPHIALAAFSTTSTSLTAEALPGRRGRAAGASKDYLVRDYLNYFPLPKSGRYPKTYSYVDVLNGRVLASAFQGKTIFIGVTAAGLGDYLPTAVGSIPGIYIQTSIFEALKSRQLIQAVPGVLSGIGLGIFVAILCIIASRLSPRAFLISTILTGVCLFTLSLLLLIIWQCWLAPAAAISAILLFYPLWSWLRLELALRFLRYSVRRIDVASSQISPLVSSRIFDNVPVSTPSNLSGVEVVERTINYLNTSYTSIGHIWETIIQSIETLREGFLLIDRNGILLLKNPRATTLLHLEDCDCIFDIASCLTIKDERFSTFKEFVNAILGGRNPQTVEAEISGESESYLLLQGCLVVKAATGNVVSIKDILVLTVIDITELKASERSRMETLNFISHDIRTPMLSTLARLERFKLALDDDSVEKVLSDITDNTERNLRFVENLLQVSKAENLPAEVFDICDIRGVLDEVYLQHRPIASQKSVSLQYSVADEDMWVFGDAALIQRCIDNLVSNALKFTDSGGWVKLAASVLDNQVLIAVSDNGRGISALDLKYLFRKYTQNRQNKSNTLGVGLGLYFVKTVMDKHGGAIEVSSEYQQGSIFTLALPIHTFDD